MDLNAIHELIADDMRAVDASIHQRLSSEVVLINQLGNYIVGNGGKRLRPVITLLAAGACNYNRDQRHILVATIIEFIHTATLLHDDVVDASEMRRGQETANHIWGNEASVLVGDFLYSRAFEMMVEVGDMRVMEILAHTTNTIAEGEVLQLLNCHDADTTEATYLEVIHCKTAKLFEAASRLGAVLQGLDRESEESLARYGMHLGTAFQLIDDALDYTATAEEMGKNVGDDLAEGKPTLPLIYAMRKGTPEQAATIRHAIEKGGLDELDAIIAAIESTDAITYTSRAARKEADLAIESLAFLPDSPYKDAMRGLADFSVIRTY